MPRLAASVLILFAVLAVLGSYIGWSMWLTGLDAARHNVVLAKYLKSAETDVPGVLVFERQTALVFFQRGETARDRADAFSQLMDRFQTWERAHSDLTLSWVETVEGYV